MTGLACEAAKAWSRSRSDESGSKASDTFLLYAARLAAVLVGLAGAAPAQAQPASPPPLVSRGAAEWTAAAGVARGIDVLQSAGGQRYAMPALAWGRVLTDLRGPRWMRGRFEWVVEVAPYFVEWREGRARGAGVMPLGWRWNLEPHGHLVPYLEVGGGALWTSEAVPAGTTGTNFTTHAGAGLRILGTSGHGVIVGYRLHHISNGNRVSRNPGVNAHMLVIGWTAIRH
jgi:hypothetical protein